MSEAEFCNVDLALINRVRPEADTRYAAVGEFDDVKKDCRLLDR